MATVGNIFQHADFWAWHGAGMELDVLMLAKDLIRAVELVMSEM